MITTVAGTGTAGFSGDGGPADKAAFDFIMCITLNHTADVLHIADLKNRRIRAFSLSSGIVSTIAGNGEKGVPEDGAKAVNAPLADPRAVAADSQGNVYILNAVATHCVLFGRMARSIRLREPANAVTGMVRH